MLVYILLLDISYTIHCQCRFRPVVSLPLLCAVGWVVMSIQLHFLADAHCFLILRVGSNRCLTFAIFLIFDVAFVGSAMMDEIMADALSMSSSEQTGWKKRKTPNLALANEPSTASSTPVSNYRGSRNKPKGAQGPGAPGQKQITHLEDVVVLMAWELLTMKQRVGALRCGANFVVILREKIGSNSWQRYAKDGVQKQQETDEGAAHPWACSK